MAISAYFEITKDELDRTVEHVDLYDFAQAPSSKQKAAGPVAKVTATLQAVWTVQMLSANEVDGISYNIMYLATSNKFKVLDGAQQQLHDAIPPTASVYFSTRSALHQLITSAEARYELSLNRPTSFAIYNHDVMRLRKHVVAVPVGVHKHEYFANRGSATLASVYSRPTPWFYTSALTDIASPEDYAEALPLDTTDTGRRLMRV